MFKQYSYEQLAQVTESIPQDRDFLNSPFKHFIDYGLASAALLDLAKKRFFYGKNYSRDEFTQLITESIKCITSLIEIREEILSPEVLVTEVKEDSQLRNRLVHAGLGVITEGAEILEAVKKSQIDWINLQEEVGDIHWYEAIIYNAADSQGVGLSPEEVKRRNILKLQKRYPDGFNKFNAINRDLDGERAILEGK